MSHLTQTKQRDILNIQNNAEETHKSESGELIKRKQMENTPFWIIGDDETGYFGTLGKYQITERYPTQEAVQNHIETQTWDIILKCAGIIAEYVINEHEQVTAKQNPNPITKI